MTKIMLTGDINLMNSAPGETPFRPVQALLDAVDFVASNLECSLYSPPNGHAIEHEGFFVDPELGASLLKASGIDVFGVANNVNYGENAILSSIATLANAGLKYAGAGRNLADARAPMIITKNGVRYGFLQRSSVYWSTNHEAGEHGVGIAVIMAHTAYHVPMHRHDPRLPPFNRPGIPPVIVTWADQSYLDAFAADIAALRPQVDVLIASCHWGLSTEILDYMPQIAKTAIDAGADIVMGHGPHKPLPIGFYKSKPIFFGLGSFSFHTGHLGMKHGDWIGLLPTLEFDGSDLKSVSFGFVRHDDNNETVTTAVEDQGTALEWLTTRSANYGARLTVEAGRVIVKPD